MKTSALIASAAATSLLLVALPATPAQAESSTDRTIIVKFDSAQRNPESAASKAVAASGGTVTDAQAITSTTVAVTVSDATKSQADRIESATDAVPGVKVAETSRMVHATSTNDEFYSYLWNLNNGANSTYGVNAEDAWATSTGSGTVVGVIDTGITNHSDLNANVISGYDFISSTAISGDGDGWDSDPTDVGDYTAEENSSWHGTHVAGTIAAVRNNSKGVVGVAPNAAIEPLRVLGTGGGQESDIVAAIRWGAGLSVVGVSDNPHPADVLNLSLGGTGTCGTTMQDAINAAVSAGTVVVVAAGNESTELATSFPANCSNVIRVTATGVDGTKSWFSNYGTASVPATIAAPGGSATDGTDTTMTHWIVSTWNDGTTTTGTESYTGMIGTSMAAPHVSAIAALLRAADSSLTVSQITALITSTATPAVSCSTDRCGAGVANAAAAVAAATSSETTTSPSPTPSPTPSTPAALSLTSPVLSRTPKVGVRVSAATTASPSTAAVTWRWMVGTTVVSTTSSYVPSAAYVGKPLSVTATASSGSQTTTKTTTATIAAGSFTKITTPTVSGTVKVGRKVTAKKGSWSPSPSSYSYQWYRSGKKISKATKATYKLTRSDRGKRISVKVTVRRAGYTKTSAMSPTRKVR